ncbi:outer membrane lipoprotein-sorting protein [Halanaerobium saccharolyticum]|uniref:Outer membrane lipoprotein-sorting protein n=1 Tax=Halanaerobium saccharolyticum TaxID=43595 RepID=A0A4V3CEU7_9FIRM|nr:outer membrane lipoprotein-sorting protein [Halanaerobium saccharolyticum]TDO90100.1 outer membrane lipoprotein-sorting protein [Halanaerobium saccharolyticum]
MLKKITIFFLILFFFISQLSLAQKLDGNQVLEKVESSRQAKSHKMKMEMELYSSSGDMRSRELNNYRLEGEVERSLMQFAEPADISGTAFLLLDDQANNQEDMYLYLPALGSVRKISGSQKNGNFVGSDLTYNDLSIFSGANFRDNYQAEMISEDNGIIELQLEITDPDIDYSYGKMWVRKDLWLAEKIEYYDQQEELLKVITLSNFDEIDGNRLARRIEVENIQKESRTILKLVEVDFDPELDPGIFTTRYLQRQ